VVALPAVASAGTPATVSVRVEGPGGQTLLPQTTVTTNTTPIDIDGNPADACSGTSAGGALYDAVHGNWGVAFSTSVGGVEINAIDGLDFTTSSDQYWSFWYDGQAATVGACSEELAADDRVVFFAQCYGVGPDCATANAPDHFLTESAPSAATVQAGTPVTVTVGSVGTGYPGGPESLPPGVSVTAGGVSVVPGAGGVASLTFPTPGTYTLQASAPDSVPSDTYALCVHNGNDGNCGTPAPVTTTTTTTATTTATVSTTTSATSTTSTASVGVLGTSVKVAPVTAFASSVRNSHVYSAAHAPRTLAGRVSLSGTLTDVRLRLTRDDDGRCSAYDGLTERFRSTRCGVAHGSFFSVGRTATFTYLLPSRLGRGRYVLDVEAIDSAGHVSALYHGTSRMVFYVK